MKEIGIFEYLKAGFCEVIIWYESGRKKEYSGLTKLEAINQLPQKAYDALVKEEFKPYKSRNGEAVKGTWYRKP